MPRGDKPTTTALALKDGWIYEDALPATITAEQYDWWFKESLVLDGVRMGPPLTTQSTTTEPTLEPCPWCPTERREIHKTEGGIVGVIIHDLGCYLARHEDDRRQVLTPHGVTAWNSRVTAPIVAPDENSVAFTAYNQAIEDAKCAIRAESQGGGYWAATFINALARKCSPHVYVNRLAAPASTVATVEQSENLCAWCKEVITTPHIGLRGERYCSVGCQAQYEDEARRAGPDWTAAPASPATVRDDAPICLKCGHNAGVDVVGTCLFGISNTNVKTWDCPCHCEFKPATTPPSTAAKQIVEEWVAEVSASGYVFNSPMHRKSLIQRIERCLFAENEDQKSTPTGL